MVIAYVMLFLADSRTRRTRGTRGHARGLAEASGHLGPAAAGVFGVVVATEERALGACLAGSMAANADEPADDNPDGTPAGG